MAALRLSKNRQLERDVGQLLWIGFHGSEWSDATGRDLCFGTSVADAAAVAGAAVIFRHNIRPRVPASNAKAGSHQAERPGSRPVERPDDLAAVVELARSLHDLSSRAGRGDGTPTWIAIDQEGGRVQRVRQPATVWPPMLSFEHVLGTSDAETVQQSAADSAVESLAEAVGEAMGLELAALGIDIDFAPVLDVHSNPANPIIGDRAFGTEAECTSRRALSFARGLASAGVLGCGKHFPGHGDTTTDSHLILPRLDHELDRLAAVELLPFRRAIGAGIPLIMTAHIVFSALDSALPATLSRRVVSGLLRRELGFAGIVVSDDLGMKAIAAHHDIGEAAVLAVQAGCDALLVCHDRDQQERAYHSLIRAAESASEIRERINQSAARIRTAKKIHFERRAALMPGAWQTLCGSAEHRNLAAKLARGAV
ncbi:MAG: beta-N-acetylhexosaminidase [Proteobacteria bacterium]|nr:beta-N-acetylhexosaminidase [Pseudomonadota bacterium]